MSGQRANKGDGSEGGHAACIRGLFTFAEEEKDWGEMQLDVRVGSSLQREAGRRSTVVGFTGTGCLDKPVPSRMVFIHRCAL